MSAFLTTGDIARKLGLDRDKVVYVIRKLGIEAVQRAGMVNLYTDEVIKPIREFLRNQEPRKPRTPK